MSVMTPPSSMDIERAFKDVELDSNARKYIRFHRYRYKYLLRMIWDLQTRSNEKVMQILDIGPAFQTFLLRKYFPAMRISTLGYDHAINNIRPGEKHFAMDLNQSSEAWPDMSRYDLILFCEVIEHLYTKPEFVLQKLHANLAKEGCMIIQTPNAAAIHKRLRLLVGLNPFELLKENKMGHFREYTASELEEMLLHSGYKINWIHHRNYFSYDRSFVHSLFTWGEHLQPPGWRDGITVLAHPIASE